MKNFLSKWGALGALLLCFQSVSSAQIAVGVSGGLNFADQRWHFPNGPLEELPFEFAALGRTSAFVEYRIKNKFSAGLELGLVQKGGKTEVEITDANGTEGKKATLRHRNNFVDCSFLFKYRMVSGKLRPYFLAAPTLGYLLNGKAKITGADVEEPGSQTFDLDGYNRTEFSLSGGAGLEISHKSRGNFFLESRYQHGFTDVVKAESVELIFRSISFSAGYAWLFGG